MPLFLLVVFGVTCAIAICMVLLVLRRPKSLRSRKAFGPHVPYAAQQELTFATPKAFVQRPGCWMAVKNRSVPQVQAALGASNSRPCSLLEGLAGDLKLFIAPPVRGWVLITGSGLPDPTDDPDRCFRFITALSRKLGQVQLFCANSVVHHHAWVRADHGKVERAYAWSGETVWNQGKFTSSEKSLRMVCTDYVETTTFEQGDGPSANAEKISSLAARWSIDPGGLEEQVLESGRGIAAEWSCRV